jgi:hypothetical protein
METVLSAVVQLEDEASDSDEVTDDVRSDLTLAEVGKRMERVILMYLRELGNTDHVSWRPSPKLRYLMPSSGEALPPKKQPKKQAFSVSSAARHEKSLEVLAFL